MDRTKGNSPPHVLTITPFYPSLGDDANGCFVAEPLGALSEAGVRHSVLYVQPFYRAPEPHNAAAPAADFVRYFALPGGLGLASAGAFLFARIIGQVRELHQTARIDAIHSHGPLPCGHAAMLVSRELKIPYVVSVHGLDAYSTEQVHGRAGEWCRRVSTRIFRCAARVIAVSEHVRERVLARASNARTSVVYNGVDAQVFSPAAEKVSTAASILSVGNLIPTKGHDVLLRAMASVTEANTGVTLDIVGEGAERSRLMSLSRELGIGNRVRFLGRLPRREVARLMSHCVLFALPSRYEGLGCVYLEAMSAAKVAIGCHGQGIDEVIRHGSNGWLIEPDNVEQLAASLKILFANSLLRDFIGNQARQTVLNGFTLKRQAEELLRVYQECCE